MKKKIMILFLFVFIFVFSIGKVEASYEYKCEYVGPELNGKKFWAKFTIVREGTTKPKVEYSHDEWDEEFVNNWYAGEEVPGTSIIGSAYTYARKCPEQIIYIRFGKGQDIYISSNTKETTAILQHFRSTENVLESAVGNLVKQNEYKEEEKEEPLSCKEFTNSKKDCEVNPYFSCMWVEGDGYSYCNVNDLQYIRCGDAFDIPKEVPPITSFLINFLKILTPLILIVISMIDLIKAIASSKEDEMKKVQQTLIKRIAAAALVFFVIAIVQFVIKKVANNIKEETSISDCLSCFINGDCNDSKYYKTNIKGTNICTTVVGQNEIECKDNN